MDFSAWLNKILSEHHVTIVNWSRKPLASPDEDCGCGGQPDEGSDEVEDKPVTRRPNRRRKDKLTAASGNTPLHDAVLAGNDTLTQELIDKNADVNARNKVGLTPLHMAVRGRYEKIVKQLIDKGANITATDDQGRNPFYVAENETDQGQKNSSEVKAGVARKRRQVPVEGPMFHVVNNSHPTNTQPQIGGQGNNIPMLSMANDGIVGAAAMLLELSARKLTGAKYGSPTEMPPTENQYLERKLDAIDGAVSAALSKFPDSGSDSARFSGKQWQTEREA